MMMKKTLFLFCVICFGWLCWSCNPIHSYSEIPEIHFKKLVLLDSINPYLDGLDKYAVLSFSFIDGDGDLGVASWEKDQKGQIIPGLGLSKIHYTWYKKLSDENYEPFQFSGDGISQESEIPYNQVMDKSEAQNKTLKGTIEIAMETPSNPQGVDIMRVEFFIVDRAGNKSNIEYTPDFSILSETGTVITK